MTLYEIDGERPAPVAAPPASLSRSVRERYGVDLSALRRVALRVSFAVKTPLGWVHGRGADRSGFVRFEREIFRDGVPPGWLCVEVELGEGGGLGAGLLPRENLMVWRARHAGGVRRWIIAWAPRESLPEAAPRGA